MKHLLAIVPLCVALAAALPAQPLALPQALDAYYESYSFVAAFSTPSERAALVGGEAEEYRLTPRQQEVIRRMDAVADLDLESDPNAIIGKRTFVRPALLRPAGLIEKADDRIILQVQVLELDPETNLRLVEAYGVALPGELHEELRSAYDGTEVHEWVREDGAWYRKPAAWRWLKD